MRVFVSIIFLFITSAPLFAGTPGVSGIETITIATLWLLLFIISIQKTASLIKSYYSSSLEDAEQDMFQN